MLTWIPAPRHRVKLSLALLGSHAQPEPNQGSPGWPGLGQVPPWRWGRGQVLLSPRNWTTPGQDVAQRGNTLVLTARTRNPSHQEEKE